MRDYFDWLVILNVRVIAQGPVKEVYTAEHLRRAYGGHIALIEQERFEEPRGADAPLEEDRH
ncbi:MAG: hypothetical protein U5K33_05975 [Halofilum sp. (in: g-proteobacteria)]|nr:hypothetical protein [Halofilum sp. (in: g-proteobacteria)]